MVDLTESGRDSIALFEEIGDSGCRGGGDEAGWTSSGPGGDWGG